jgi:hypothetical protein
MKKIILFILAVSIFSKINGQSITLDPNGASSQSIINASTTNQGVLFPSMNSLQRTSIVSPVNGLLVYDTDTNGFWYSQNGVWTELPKVSLWSVNGVAGNEIRNTNNGGFWSSNAGIVPYLANDITNPPTSPTTGLGTRLMWIPSRSAFRCGTVNGDAWDANNVGLHSFASGYNSRASGLGNIAFGTNAISDGTSNTIAFGENTQATGNNGLAMGYGARVNSQYGIAIGNTALADGSSNTIAIGQNTNAVGTNGVAIGTGTNANSYYSIAMGYNNLPIASNATSWVSTDPLLYIGNGQTSGTQSNALVIQKNGVINIGTTPNASTSFKLKVGGSISASLTVQANNLRATSLSGTTERHVCTDANGNLIECASQNSYYNVSALGFHPVLSNTTPSTTFVRNVDRALISFANNTKTADAYAFAPVELPDGVTVTKLTMNYLQNTGGSMILTFYSVEKLTNAVGTVEGTITSIAGTGILEKTLTLDKPAAIDNSKYYYYLKLIAGSSWQGTDMAMRGVIFAYTK